MSCCGEKIAFKDNLRIKAIAIIYILKMIPSFKVFWRFVKGYIKVNFFGKDQIRFVEIFVTLACNANCDFCSNGLFTNKSGNVTKEKYLEIIDECAELNVPVVCLIGGEPLLYPYLLELIERIDSRGMMSMLATNGFILTESKVADLKKAGLTNVTISLHSLDPAKHDDSLKLPGAYEKAMAARKYCKKYGVSFSLATVVSHQEFSDGTFDRLVEFAEDNRIPLSVNPLIPTGNACGKIEDLLRYEDVKKLNRISKKSRYISTHLTNNYFGFGCPAGSSYLGINATGEIFPCFFVPVSLGNIRDVSLKDAWDKARKSPIFTKRHKMCYAGVSREFINDYLFPIFNANEVIPLPIERHPLWRDGSLPDIQEADIRKAIEHKKIVRSDIVN